MRKARKLALGALCACALAAGSVAATVAYLTSTDEAVNTFTVGNVAIHLDEADTDGEGADCEFCAEGRDHANAYHLIPGIVYDKDPTVTVLEGSEECYVRVLVTVSDVVALEEAFGEGYMSGDMFMLERLVGGWDPAEWECAGYAKDGKVGTYEFRYSGTVAAPADEGTEGRDDVVLDPLFETIAVPGDEIDNDELKLLEGVQVSVVAQAIQAAGFGDAAAAWEKF